MDLAKQDLSQCDFSSDDLSGQSLGHSTITGCRFGDCRGANFVCTHGESIDFRGADITGATFEKADESVLKCLVGARWNGIEITHVSGWIVQSYYWSFATNAFVQCGCMTKTLQDWQQICQDIESIRVLHDEQPTIDLVASLAWWRESRDAIVRTIQSFGT